MLPALLFAALVPMNTPVSCDDVRRVRSLVASEGLDDASLRTVEAKYCSPKVAGPAPERYREKWSRECIDLRIMTTLGRAGGATGLEEIEGLANVACSMGLSQDRFSWRNGTTARSSSGAWNWPSGTSAKYASGAWNWPSGTSARYASGAWNWPSGTSAKYASGRWHFPSGASAAREQLVAPVCAKDPEACRELARLSEVDEDLATATLLSLAWARR